MYFEICVLKLVIYIAVSLQHPSSVHQLYLLVTYRVTLLLFLVKVYIACEGISYCLIFFHLFNSMANANFFTSCRLSNPHSSSIFNYSKFPKYYRLIDLHTFAQIASSDKIIPEQSSGITFLQGFSCFSPNFSHKSSSSLLPLYPTYTLPRKPEKILLLISLMFSLNGSTLMMGITTIHLCIP